MAGWISLHRSIEDHWTFKEKRTFSKFEAWIDLLMMVNHKDNKILLGNELITVKRGQKITSIRKLCERWSWSNNKVKKFLNLLEEDGMLSVKSDTKKTVLTIANYDVYQSEDIKKRHESDADASRKRHGSDTDASRVHTNNNELIRTNNDSIMKNNEQQNNAIREIVEFYEGNGYGTVGSLVIEDFSEWLNQGFEKESIIHALEIGVTKNNRTMKYIRGIINNWKKQNTKSMNDIKAADSQRSYSQKSHSEYQLTPEQQAQVDQLGF